MIEYRINDFQDFTSAIVLLMRNFGNVRLWWRGQEESDWKLTPGIFRSGDEKKEQDINNLFRMKAKTRYSNCPNRDDLFSWLFLMQHYRLPTRLLDWTENPLVALFFAVENKKSDDKDAAIWALKPSILNSTQVKKNKILLSGNVDAKPIVSEAFNVNSHNPDRKIVAVNPEQADIRQLIQQSEFTVHGSPTPMENLNESDMFLGKILIPSNAKVAFRQLLTIFGISRSYLFPDLENLSIELASLEFDYEARLLEESEIIPIAPVQVENE